MPEPLTEKLDLDGLVATLRGLLEPGADIVLAGNPGNAGDALIAAGCWNLFERCGVAGSVRRRGGADRAGEVFVYPGGGNLVPAYANARQAFERAMAMPFRRYLLMPHTVRGHADLLARMDERFHLFCRDLETLAHVRAHAPRAHAYLTDDAAFAIDLDALRSPWPRRFEAVLLRSRPHRWSRIARWRRAIDAIRPVHGELVLMRADVEARGGAAADPALDLSGLYGSDYPLRSEAMLVTHDFLGVLERAERIVTDRLHVAIGASLLGKPVRLHDNNYGKNRAIWELSLRGRFPRTEFVPPIA